MLNESPELKDWEKSVIKDLPSGARILDIGCGLGREAFALADLGFDDVVIWAQTLGLIYGNEHKKAYLSECKKKIEVL